MSEETSYDKLKKSLPEIAEAVKAFDSPELQGRAFDALLNAAGLAAKPPAPSTAKTPAPKRKKPSTGSQKKARKAKSAANPKTVKDLVLSPRGDTSLSEFVAEKSPNAYANHRATVAVYYLEHVRGQSGITVDHVYTCFRDQGWKLPARFDNTLQVTASKNGWLDTSNMEDIKMTPRGVNFVEQELPSPAKK